MYVALAGANEGVPGELTVSVQVPGAVDVMSVDPLTKQGPLSSIVTGAPEAVAVDMATCVFVRSGTGVVGHELCPAGPTRTESAARARLTFIHWLADPLALLFDAEKFAVRI